MVVHTCHPYHPGIRSKFQANPGKVNKRPYLKNKDMSGHRWLKLVIPASWETEIWRITVQGQSWANSS
jgi:hypothetical protein